MHFYNVFITFNVSYRLSVRHVPVFFVQTNEDTILRFQHLVEQSF